MNRKHPSPNVDIEIGELSLGGLAPHRRRALELHIREAVEAQLAARPIGHRGGLDLTDIDVRVRHDDDGLAIGRRVAQALFAAVHPDREAR